MPRNVILVIGDGMGFEQIAAASYYQTGTEQGVSFHEFPFAAEVRTASADSAITDSAASATAMATGVKVANGVISRRISGDGAPLEGIRIRIWAHPTEGHERAPHSHGATLTDAEGRFAMDMPQIVPAFGQAHGHLAYDAEYDGRGFQTVFLRPLMASSSDTTLNAEFVLLPA